jgi:hypothetical protein
MSKPDFNWPKKGDQAFPEPNPKGRSGLLEAFIMPLEDTYLTGFQRAADIIVSAIPILDGTPDSLFFPVAYLYRHHLELMLKELVSLGIQMGSLKGCESVLESHNLQMLWKNAKQLIMGRWPKSPGEDMRAADHVVMEFHKLDPSGQAFRYARDKKGAPSLVDAPRVVDLGNLKAVVDGVSSFLDASYAGIEASDPGQL